MANPFAVAFLPLWLSALAMFALAAWLLATDRGRTANRVFAALLALRGMTFVLGPLRATASTEEQFSFYAGLAPFVIIPLVPLALYFASVHPRQRGPLASHGWVPWALAAGTAAAMLWALLDPSAYGTIVPDPDGRYMVSAGPGHAYQAFGPLILFTALRLPAMAVPAVVFARDYVRTPPGSPRYSSFLLFAGFALNAVFDGTNALMSLPQTALSGNEMQWWPWGWSLVWLPVLTLLLAMWATGIVVHGQLRGPYRSSRGVRLFVVAAGIAVGTATLGNLVRAQGGDVGADLVSFLLGVWRFTLPVLVSYALLRYSLFEIDQKVRSVVAHGTIVLGFAAVLVVLSEFVEYLVSEARGAGYGLGAGAAMAILFQPLDRLGDVVAGRLLPDAKPLSRLTPEERGRFYADQYALASEDGALSRRERYLLDVLAEQLGLDRTARRRLEGRA